MLYNYTRSELKAKKASDYKDGDVINVGVYYIYIHYKSRDGKYTYNKPSLCSRVEKEAFKPCGCVPGRDIPYYIDNFLNS